MPVERWRPFRFERLDPFRDLIDMQSEVNRAFDAYFGRQARPGAMDRVWAPAVDIYETKDDLVVTAELPGVKEKDVHLSIVGDVLSLRGQRASENQVNEENYHRVERWSGQLRATHPAPDSRAGRQGAGDLSGRGARGSAAQG